MSDIHVPQPASRFLWLSLPVLGLAVAAMAGPYTQGSSGPDMQHHGMAATADAGGKGVADARPATIVRPVSCERLPNVPGKSITTVVVDFPPGAYSPRHRHPGSVMAFVLVGKVRSQLDAGPAETFNVGQTWFEPPGTIHMFAENASMTEPASVLATFVADDDCGPLTIFE